MVMGKDSSEFEANFLRNVVVPAGYESSIQYMSASESGGVANDQKGIGSTVPCLVGSTLWEEGRHVFRMETSDECTDSL